MNYWIVIISIVIAGLLAVTFGYLFPVQRTRAADQGQILFSEFVKLPDGRTVVCVFSSASGGVDCDFKP